MIDEKGNIWFIARDIAQTLGYIRKKDNKVDVNAMTRKIDDEDKGTTNVRTLGGQQQMVIINESGLYIAIFGSSKPEAKEFKLWVTREVLPSIRKNGFYSISDNSLEKLKKRTEFLAFASQQTSIFKLSYENIGIKNEELGITINRAVKVETTIDFLEIAGIKGLETKEKFFTVTELCDLIRKSDDFSEKQKLSISTKKNDKARPQNLNNLLRDSEFQIKDNGVWKATDKGEKFSQFVKNKSKYSDKTVFHTVWNFSILKEIF